MLDVKLIRESPETVEETLRKRGTEDLIHEVHDLVRMDSERKALAAKIGEMRAERNKATQEIAKKKAEGEDVSGLAKRVKGLPAKIEDLELKLKDLEERIKTIQYKLPNLLHESVPVGKGDEDNVEIRRWGEEPKFDFKPKGHEDLAFALGGLDLERAAKIAGARFYFLKGQLAILHHAVLRFALDSVAKKGYTPIVPPYMMKKGPYEGVVDISQFKEVLYRVMQDELFLIATTEHPMGAMYMGEILDEADLPIKLVGISPAFRTEAGSHGKDTKGIFRVHQFDQVEQFVFCKPEQSWDIHEELQANAEEIIRALELPHRVVTLCSADTPGPSSKTYDINVFWPGQENYKEIASCSNVLDFQARRLGIRWRHLPGKPPAGFVHMLNATGVPSPRIIAAILENFQQPDGSVRIPKALQPYTGFKEISTAKASRLSKV